MTAAGKFGGQHNWIRVSDGSAIDRCVDCKIQRRGGGQWRLNADHEWIEKWMPACSTRKAVRGEVVMHDIVQGFSIEQMTKSFPDGAPDRAEYNTDSGHVVACELYQHEWRDQYRCVGCKEAECPQCALTK